METHDQPKSEPELVQISVDGQPYFAFKWWDQQQVDGRDVRYVVKDPTYDVISYMLIICANRVPRETDLVAMKFYAVEKPNESGYWPAETTWTSGDVDIGSAVRICSPKETYQEYRGLPRDIEYLIREYKEGRLQLRHPGKKDVTLEMVHAKVIDIGKDTSSLLDTAAENKQRIETLCLNTDAMAKNEYELRQENVELQRLQADGYLKFAAKVNGGDFTALIYIMALGNRKNRRQVARSANQLQTVSSWRRVCERTGLLYGELPRPLTPQAEPRERDAGGAASPRRGAAGLPHRKADNGGGRDGNRNGWPLGRLRLPDCRHAFRRDAAAQRPAGDRT